MPPPPHLHVLIMMGHTCVRSKPGRPFKVGFFQVLSQVKRLIFFPRDSSVSPFTPPNPFYFRLLRQQGAANAQVKVCGAPETSKSDLNTCVTSIKPGVESEARFSMIPVGGRGVSPDSPPHPQIITTLLNLSPRTRGSSTSSKRRFTCTSRALRTNF